jgi:dolichol-phosphate mannosyltransferase
MLGLGFALVGFVASIALVVTFLVAPPREPGWGSMIVALTMFFGVTFLILGVMSEYLSRIYRDSSGRPLYFIANDTAAPDVRRLRAVPEGGS